MVLLEGGGEFKSTLWAASAESVGDSISLEVSANKGVVAYGISLIYL